LAVEIPLDLLPRHIKGDKYTKVPRMGGLVIVFSVSFTILIF
jgi:UDP-N-acetylmuramyl pentapeptide phosphotransferase/UDP-N-acetylglucosamine-1-phosphate transferase